MRWGGLRVPQARGRCRGDGEDRVGVCVAERAAAAGVRRFGLSFVPVCQCSGPVVREPCKTLGAQVLCKVFRV